MLNHLVIHTVNEQIYNVIVFTREKEEVDSVCVWERKRGKELEFVGRFHQHFKKLLRAQIPRAQIRPMVWLYFFAVLGSMHVKAVRKTLMKLTPCEEKREVALWEWWGRKEKKNFYFVGQKWKNLILLWSWLFASISLLLPS